MFLVVCGALGGLLPDVIRLIRVRHDPAIPAYLGSPVFYVGLALCALLGAFTAKVLGASNVTQALAYGFAAPEILTRVLSSAGRMVRKGAGGEVVALAHGGDSQAVAGQMTLRDWWQR